MTAAVEQARSAPPELWAVHLQGSDDILATRYREDAEFWKERYDETDSANSDVPTVPRIDAKVIPWPYSPEAHAESLAKQEAEQW